MNDTAEHQSTERPAKIVHVSTVHQSGDVRVFVKQCRTLAAAGHDVTLYARADEPRVEDGVRVVPVPQPRGRLRRMTVAVAGLLRPLLAERADVYHLHDPELVPLGLLLRLLGRRVIFDSHEDLPAQVLEKAWIPAPARPWAARGSRVLVRIAGRGLSAIVAATPTIAERFAGARVVTVNNFPIQFDGGEPPAYDRRTRGMAYVGGIVANRGFDTMVDVARRVHAETGHTLTLAGPYQPAALADQLSADDHRVVDYLGVLSPGGAREVMAQSRVGLLLYRRSRAHEDAMPNKLFEYMAEGLPVVASDFPLWRELVQQTGAGLVVPPDDAEVVADAVLEILGDPEVAAAMGERGRRAVLERFSWEAEATTLLDLYDELLPAGVRRARAPVGAGSPST